MDIRKELELEHSKKNTTKIVNEICRSPKKMNELMQVFINSPYRISQRAAWPLSYIAEKRPELLANYYDLLINQLNATDNHPAVTRNILRAFQFVDIPEEHQGNVLDVSFNLLNNPNEPIAVKAFSMTVIFNLSKKYPDIIPELKASIESLMPNASAGIKNRGNKILKAIQKR